MELHASNPNITTDSLGNTYLTVSINEDSLKLLQDNRYYISMAAGLNIDIQRLYGKRSLNANAMFWSLCGQLADKLETSNEEMYLSLIEKYGVYEVITLKDDVAESFKKSINEDNPYKLIKFIGKVVDNGVSCQQFLCYIGSSQYNTKQMSRLLRETVYECKNVGIPSYSNLDVDIALQNWGTKEV